MAKRINGAKRTAVPKKKPAVKAKPAQKRAPRGYTKTDMEMLEDPLKLTQLKKLHEIRALKSKEQADKRLLLPVEHFTAKARLVFQAGRSHAENLPGRFKQEFAEATSEMLDFWSDALKRMLDDMVKAGDKKVSP